jgi:endonuclease/exonuclease/phosphatase family metal-dependent hydrolase
LRQAGWRARALAAAVCALAGILTLTLAAPGVAEAAKRKKRGVPVKVMTRNVYLGSSLQAGLSATNFDELCDGARQILNDVDSTNPPVRMRAIANEIRNLRPDLVGLQEVAAWYTQTPGDGRPPLTFGGGTLATTVEHDFLQLILKRLNQGKKRYKVVSVSNEFEFEAEADLDGLPSDSPAPDCADAESDARMLMRDVILARVKAGVRTTRPQKGNFVNQLLLNVGGFPFAVKRGWEATNVRVRGSRKFRFVNTHLEAFDSDATANDMYNTSTDNTTTVSRGTIRKTQAQEILSGPAKAKLPVVLLGDLNSNVPGVQTGDQQAFQAVLNAGFLRRSTQKPPSCCTDVLNPVFSEFDHVVDQIVANRKRIKRRRSGVVGRAVVGGQLPSDHAGVWSVLRIPR